MKFVKMHGTGNDFVIIEPPAEEVDWPALAKKACDRHFGIGADGVILALPSERADMRMRIFNPDGSEAEMCGNGIRCLSLYALEKGLARGDGGALTVDTLSGILTAELERKEGQVQQVRVAMGKPRFAAQDLPMAIETDKPIIDYPLQLDGAQLSVTCLSMGNPHAVHFLSQSLNAYPLETVGPRVEHHPLFPQRTNFEVAFVHDRENIEMRVWERGAGMTMACGSGACAVTVAARLRGMVADKAQVALPGGVLTIEWDGEGDVYLSGPAEFVFEGNWTP